MENTKNNTALFSLIFLVIGLLIGFMIWGGNRNMHRMPNGQMMSNNHMNMEGAMGGMMSGLSGKTGDDFDKAFLSEMIVHHEGAVEMAKFVLTTSKRPELIKMANDIITVQTKEIDMMKSWQTNWFK